MARQPPGLDEIGNQVRLDLGPVAPASLIAWIAWVDEVVGEFGNDPSRKLPCAELLCGADGYLEQWRRPDHSVGGTFRWHADVDPDELEYLLHGLLSLDARLARDVGESERLPAPCGGRDFYVVLVRDLLHALELEGPGRAAFVDQLRCCWPSAVKVR